MQEAKPWRVAVLLGTAALACGQGVARAQAVCDSAASANLSIDFGHYKGATLDAVSNALTLRCQGGAQGQTVQLCLVLGQGTGGAAGSARTLKQDVSSLQYQLYRDAARTQVYAQTPAHTFDAAFFVPAHSPATTYDTGIKLYGRVFAGQTPTRQGAHTSAFAAQHAQVKWRAVSGNQTTGCSNASFNTLNGNGFVVLASVPTQCSLTILSPLNFGAHVARVNGAKHSVSSLRVDCTNPTAYKIGMDKGQHPGGVGAGVRRMVHTGGQHYVHYEIFRPAHCLAGAGNSHQVWGARGSSQALSCPPTSAASHAHPIYATAYPQEQNAAGSYQDTVVVTLEY